MKVLEKFKNNKVSGDLLLPFGIFILAFLLRIVFINKVPVSLNWDETSFAYNAYSILKTGKDEYGNFMPLQFKSVGDYKAPLFIYALVPFIKIFGLNLWSVRLLPSLTSSFSVVAFYFIVKVLTQRKVAFVSALMLCFSPWHLQFSRGGADVGFATIFTTAGIAFFLYGNKKPKLYYLSAVFFSLSIYSYFGERLFVPLIFLWLLFVNRKQLFERKKILLKIIFVILIFALPIFSSLVSQGHQEKILKTTVFGYQRPSEYVTQVQKLSTSVLTYDLFHSSLAEGTFGFIDRYLTHFSPRFLFFFGPSEDPRQYIFEMGMLYLFDLPFIFLGITSLGKLKKKNRMFTVGWLLLAPLPAAITRDPVHARRAFNMVYPLLMLSSLGFWESAAIIKKQPVKLKKLLLVLAALVSTYLLAFYFISYYIYTPKKNYKGPAGWQWGYQEVVNKVTPLAAHYQKVVVDTTYQGPYIFFLFFQKYPPELYQPQARLIQADPQSLGEGAGYDNYEFRPIYWPEDRYKSGHLFVGPPERVRPKDIDPNEARVVEQVLFPNGEVAWLIVEVY